MPVDSFSVRWSRKLAVEPGLYRLNALADDGIRLYLDGRLLIDEWHISNGERMYSVDVNLTGLHKLALEYYENSGEARVKFWWGRVDGAPVILSQ
jgi:beta-glucosidase